MCSCRLHAHSMYVTKDCMFLAKRLLACCHATKRTSSLTHRMSPSGQQHTATDADEAHQVSKRTGWQGTLHVVRVMVVVVTLGEDVGLCLHPDAVWVPASLASCKAACKHCWTQCQLQTETAQEVRSLLQLCCLTAWHLLQFALALVSTHHLPGQLHLPLSSCACALYLCLCLLLSLHHLPARRRRKGF